MKVSYSRCLSANLSNVPVVDGQIILCKDIGALYMDVGGDRVLVQSNVELNDYQKKYDATLETDNKTITGSINELKKRVLNISTDLVAGWNTVSVGRLYPVDWSFLGKPFCVNDEGVPIDFSIRNWKSNVQEIDGQMVHTFEINVSEPCTLEFATAPLNIIRAILAKYAIVQYYYTGNDGKDLDTVTAILNENWSLDRSVGYGHKNEIKDSTGNNLLIKFGGDNTGGGSTSGGTRFYESVFLDIHKIKEILPTEDIEIVLYGTWFSQKLNGNIHVTFTTFNADNDEYTLSTNNNLISINADGLNTTFENQEELECAITTIKGATSEYKTTYTPAFKITLHKVQEGTDLVTITIDKLS